MGKLIDKILIIINFIVGILLILSYLIVYFNPAKIWYFSFLGLAYPIFLLTNFLLFLYWTVKLKKAFLISFIAIIIGFNHHITFIQLSKDKVEKKDNNIKVISYNIRFFDRYNWTKEKNTSQKILEFLKKENSDIICLQEFYYNDKTKLKKDSILKSLKNTPYYFNETKFGNIILSKYPILKKGKVKFKHYHTAEVIYCDIVKNRDTLRVYNVHLESLGLKRKNYEFIKHIGERAENYHEYKDIFNKLHYSFKLRAHQIAKLKEHALRSKHPVIISGDFNDTYMSYTYNEISSVFKDAFIGSGLGISPTYRGEMPAYRIDYIFTSDDFTCYKYERYNVNYSDHYPIISEFNIN